MRLIILNQSCGTMRAVLCGYYGYGNGGDEALLACLLQMLPAHVTPVVLSGNPVETRARYHVEAYPRKSPLTVLRVLRQADAFIWGGGSLMQDATSLANPLYYGGLMILAQTMGLKTIAWAQGIGPLNHPFSRWLAHWSFKGCQGVSVRDEGSAALLEKFKVPWMLAPDPVWAMEATPVKGLWDLPAPRIALVLRSHPRLTPARLEHLTRALIDFQIATQTCVLLVPFQAAQDLAIAQAIQPRLQGPSRILQIEDPQELKGLFRGVEMTIAMRLHGLIMAAAEGCRCFALSYDPKVSRLMAELDLPGWELSDIPENPHSICQTWLDYYANGQPISHDRIHSLVDRAFLHQELLSQVLNC